LRRLSCLFRRIVEERADSGELAGGRGRPKPFGPPLREKGSQIRSAQSQELVTVDRFAAMPPQEVDEPVSRRNISANGVGRAASIVL
jgi:hypothetical protein